MKKILTVMLLTVAFSTQASAQEESEWTLNTRAWSTNYFTTMIYGAVETAAKEFLFDGNFSDSLWAERLIPSVDLVFPVGMGKKGFEGNDIYGPYHRAFGNPFKHIGDYAIGLDVSFKPSFVGVYAGAFFKSQEVVYKEINNNLRGFFFQPRAGIILGNRSASLEAGVFYDAVTGCKSSAFETSKKMLKSGLGLDFAISHSPEKRNSKTMLQFSMPLHNFFDTSYPGLQGVKRKVGYIMLTERVYL